MSTETDYPPSHYVLENKLQSRTLDGWTKANKITLVLVILTTVGVFAWEYADSISVAIVYAVFAFWVLWQILIKRRKTGWGRGHEVIWFWIKGMRVMQHKGVWWSVPTGAGRRPKVISSQLIPVKRIVIEAKDIDGKLCRIPLLHHLDQPYDQLFIRARGGVFASHDGGELYYLNQVLAQIFDQTLSMTDLHAGIASLFVPAPISDHDFQLEMSQKGSPLVTVPEYFKPDDQLKAFSELQAKYMLELIPALQSKGAKDNWGLIVITIKRKGEWKGIEQGKLGDEELYNLPVLELGRSLVEGLQSHEILGLSDVHILEPHELLLLNRASWDVFGIDAFYDDYYAILSEFAAKTTNAVAIAREDRDEPMSAEEITEIKQTNDRLMYEALDTRLSPWPKEIVSVNKTCVRMDNNWISVLRIEEVPKAITDDEYLNQLRVAPLGEWVRRYYGGESISGERETLTIMSKQVTAANWFGLIADKVIVTHPKMRQIQQDLADKAELASHHAIAQLSSKYWVVVAPSKKLNREQTKKLRANLRTRGFKARVVNVVALHIDAVLTAAFGAARM